MQGGGVGAVNESGVLGGGGPQMHWTSFGGAQFAEVIDMIQGLGQ